MKFVALCFLMGLRLLASEPDISAYRDEKLPFSYYEELMRRLEKSSTFGAGSAIGAARFYTGEISADAPSWGPGELLRRYRQLRDERFLRWSSRPSFPRRISWLYPDDGCYARAAVANKYFKDRSIGPPGKVFAFGRLSVKTSNHPRGRVGWWYHVAPVVDVEGEKMVLDPSINPRGPLKLGDWLARMGTPSKIRVSICEPGTYGPKSSCADDTVGSEGASAQQSFLSSEWARVRTLGKKPEELLGPNPPWRSDEKWRSP